jgi:hypothetical protein
MLHSSFRNRNSVNRRPQIPQLLRQSVVVHRRQGFQRLEQDGIGFGFAGVRGKGITVESVETSLLTGFCSTFESNVSTERHRHKDPAATESSETRCMRFRKSHLPHTNLHLGCKYNHRLELVWVSRAGSADVHGTRAGRHLMCSTRYPAAFCV